jgi:predicted amidohydrolase
MGLSICYDVRFPYLYRHLAQREARILTVPSAFTVSTGQMHWEVLLRARAIENGAFVIAPAQCGTHEGGRQTYGHSLIIDPWGKILAEGGDTPVTITADMDMAEGDRFRESIPSLAHDRIFS